MQRTVLKKFSSEEEFRPDMTRMHIFPRDVAYLFLSVNELGKKSRETIILGSFVKKKHN